jgi:hypothetical protein
MGRAANIHGMRAQHGSQRPVQRKVGADPGIIGKVRLRPDSGLHLMCRNGEQAIEFILENRPGTCENRQTMRRL